MALNAFFGALFGILHYAELSILSDFHANMNFAFALSNLLLLLLLRLKRAYYQVVQILMLLSMHIDFTSLLIELSQDEFRAMWYYILVAVAYLSAGLRVGIITSILSIVTIVISNMLFDLEYSDLAIVTMIAGLIILSITQIILTDKLQQLQDGLLHINAKLHEQVEDQVETLREKDRILLAQAKQAQMGEMLSMIAHQWRQPLASISLMGSNMQLDLAMGKEISKEQLAYQLQKFDKAVRHLSSTIDDFRNFYQNSHVSHEVEPIALVHEACDILATAIQNSGLKIEIENRVKRHINTLDREVVQVIINIITNTIDAYAPNSKKTLTILLDELDDTIQIVLSDQAGGIDEAIIDKVFDPYFSTKSQKNGAGLGLYMSALIINEHCQGALSAKNVQDGASFTIGLPFTLNA